MTSSIFRVIPIGLFVFFSLNITMEETDILADDSNEYTACTADIQ